MEADAGKAIELNLLTDPWLEVVDLNARSCVRSPLECLRHAGDLAGVAVASPLDAFAAERFLLTLIYWKAPAGGIDQVRRSLLDGAVPPTVLDAIEAERSCFSLLDRSAPFLQDIGAPDHNLKSAGSLFAEFSVKSNVAHFHHGDDDEMRLCLPCAAAGLLRVVPWTQSGGRGLSPSIHNAPPIMAVAIGDTLCETLGLNFVPLVGNAGVARWSGHFRPTNRNALIPYLEAFTWNPRRIRLSGPEAVGLCWRCGRQNQAVVGRLVYEKNDDTRSNKQGKLNVPFDWRDPAAFYSGSGLPAKSYDENDAASGRDLASLLGREHLPVSSVVQQNVGHRRWRLALPCTDPANNKTFDHRAIELDSLSRDSLRALLPADIQPAKSGGLDGWTEPRGPFRAGGTASFVLAAVRLLTHADWIALSGVAHEPMHYSPAAFDVFSGLFWLLRQRKMTGLPSRNAGWLTLKLMAGVPARSRIPSVGAAFCPLRALAKRQRLRGRDGRPTPFQYPISFPNGRRLEGELRRALDAHLRKRAPGLIDWVGFCHRLGQMIGWN